MVDPVTLDTHKRSKAKRTKEGLVYRVGEKRKQANHLIRIVDVEESGHDVMDDAVQPGTQAPAGHNGRANLFGLEVQRCSGTWNRLVARLTHQG